MKAEVSEIDLASVSVGSVAQVRLVNGTTMDGTVRLVAREATASTRTFPVEIALPNPDLTLPSGMTAEVQLFAPAVRAVVVPRELNHLGRLDRSVHTWFENKVELLSDPHRASNFGCPPLALVYQSTFQLSPT